MSLRRVRNRFRKLMVALAVSLCVSVPAWAEVADVVLKDLIAQSDVIVVATVTKIEPAPDHIRAVEERYPPVKAATARVVETWKGPAVKDVRFVAAPTQYCDTAHATKGEKLVLFLERHGDGPMMIAHVGRGGMSIHDVKGKPYVTVSDQVILPRGTRTISETKKDSVTLPARLREPGKKGTVTVDFTYELRSIELGTLRSVVCPEKPRDADTRRQVVPRDR